MVLVRSVFAACACVAKGSAITNDRGVARAWNIFSIGRRRGNEDQLTEMLAWLAGAVPAVRDALIEMAFGESLDGADVEITTQHGIAEGRLDALLSSPSLALVIESKLGSDYGGDQLGKYLRWLDAQFAERPYRGLVTLTARAAEWPLADKTFAAERGIIAQARLWEELHEALALFPTGESDLGDRNMNEGDLGELDLDKGDLHGQLVDEFLEMLTDEGLVPMKPLTADELQGAWSDSYQLIQRYQDFFHACKGAIGEELGAELISGAKSDRSYWFWQDYALTSGARLVVGLHYTDEAEKAPGYVPSRTPTIFIAAEIGGEDEQATYTMLEASPPSGWYIGPRWYGTRPQAWRPLAPILDATSVDEQRKALARTVSVGREWVERASTAERA
jgi:hypothetical protein